MKRTCLLALSLGLMLLAHGAAHAQTYTLQPIVKLGDKVGNLTIKVDDGDFEVSALNDAGQLVFVTENEAGGEMLVQVADGKPTPIYNADLAFRGVVVPDGRHALRMEFRPAILAISIGISLATAMLLITLTLWRKQNGRGFHEKAGRCQGIFLSRTIAKVSGPTNGRPYAAPHRHRPPFPYLGEFFGREGICQGRARCLGAACEPLTNSLPSAT